MELPTAVKKKMEEAKAGVTASQSQPPAPSEAVKQEAQPKPAPQPAPVSTRLQPRGESKAESEAEKLEHKYKVLQGMHKKETAELREKIAELEAKVSQVSAPVKTGTPNFSDYGITPEQVEEYGPEYWETQINIQRTMVAQAAQASGSSVQSEELDQLKRKVEVQDRERFYQRLDQLVPDWKEVDTSAGWDAFLGQTDEASGLTNEELLSDAFEQNDASRVAALFSRYKSAGSGSHNAPVAQNVAPETKQAPSLQVRPGKMTMDRWVKEVNELLSKGLNTVQMANEHDRLKAMMRNGEVVGGPGQEPDPMATTAFV